MDAIFRSRVGGLAGTAWLFAAVVVACLLGNAKDGAANAAAGGMQGFDMSKGDSYVATINQDTFLVGQCKLTSARPRVESACVSTS